MLFDAIVVAGGRSSRLGGRSKADLLVEGRTLLRRAIDAASGAQRVVVVGPDSLLAGLDSRDPDGQPDLDDRLLLTREDPPFGGPVAALAAGLEALDDDFAEHALADHVLVLACDMPFAAVAVSALVNSAEAGRGRQVAGFVAIDETQHPQPLLAVYDTARLADAFEELGPDVANLSMRAVLAQLDLIAVAVPPGSTDDVDTWADAARYGIAEPEESNDRRG